jgi:hypothetical protein
MPRKYPFYPSWDGGSTSPVTKKFYDLCKRRWAFTNLGMYANRPMRGSKNLSVHATGYAVDIGYPATRAGRATAREAWDWFLEHSEALLICEIHDYSFGEFGRGYRCSRSDKNKGVVVYKDLASSAGSPGGAWLHVEVSNEWESAEAFEAAWRALPKPVKTP